MSDHNEAIMAMTADIVAAHVGHNSVSISDLPTLIRNVHDALSGLSDSDAVPEARPEPAVSIRASVKPDYIVCLHDGMKLKVLKRHLAVHHGISGDEYRAQWGLPADYPMVAPNYAQLRHELAVRSGLGRKAAKRKK